MYLHKSDIVHTYKGYMATSSLKVDARHVPNAGLTTVTRDLTESYIANMQLYIDFNVVTRIIINCTDGFLKF